MAEHPTVAAMRRLHRLLTERIGDSVAVDLGPVQGTTEALEVVVIGADDDGDETAVVDGGVTYPGMGGVQHHELEISCVAQSISGEDPLGWLSRCYDLVDQVASIVADDDADDGLSWGRVTRYRVRWTETDAGFGAAVPFAVAVSAIRRMGRRG